MQSLENLINRELENLPKQFDNKFYKISEFITDDTKSAEFIRNILKDDTFIHPDEKSPMYEVAKSRSRHSALTFLIGLVFKEFGGLYDSFKATTQFGNEHISLKLWMMTALSHDKGYYSERLKKNVPAHQQNFSHLLLTDNYTEEFSALKGYSNVFSNVLAYTYQDITTYDIAAINYHINRNDSERVDHGILGGCIVFNDYINKLQKATATSIEKELYSIKTCALTIAQHNMFKSAKPQEDIDFPNKPQKLQYGDPFKISTQTPLLLFLSLIDTFECIKKFSKEENDTNVRTLTALKKIKLRVDTYSITIDYSELFEHIKSKKDDSLNQSKKNYLDSIMKLNNWTVLQTAYSPDSDTYKITIS